MPLILWRFIMHNLSLSICQEMATNFQSNGSQSYTETVINLVLVTANDYTFLSFPMCRAKSGQNN